MSESSTKGGEPQKAPAADDGAKLPPRDKPKTDLWNRLTNVRSGRAALREKRLQDELAKHARRKCKTRMDNVSHAYQ